MHNSFLGATVRGFPAEPKWVHVLLMRNPSFARVCGFVPRQVRDEYSSEHSPSLRKLEQFDQIMTGSGIGDKIKEPIYKKVEKFSLGSYLLLKIT